MNRCRHSIHVYIRVTFVLSMCGLVLIRSARGSGVAVDEFFEKEIRPVLVERCQTCHGDQKPKGGLRLTSREALLKGGDSGPAISPGRPDESLLIHAIRYLDEP